MMFTMTYELQPLGIHDRIEHQARIRISAGEPMTTATNWKGEQSRFQPKLLTIIWEWNWETSGWELATFYVRGLRLNKDGGVNARGMSEGRSLERAGFPIPEAPAQFIELLTEHYPAWVVAS